MVLSCLSKPGSSRKGYSNKSSVCDCWSFKCEIRSSVLFVAFSAISYNSISSVLVMSDTEGNSSAALFSITACQAAILPTGMLKPNLQSLFLPYISAIIPTNFSFPSVVKGFLLPM